MDRLDTFFQLISGQKHIVAAALAFDADIRACAQHFKIMAFTGMRFLQCNDISDLNIHSEFLLILIPLMLQCFMINDAMDDTSGAVPTWGNGAKSPSSPKPYRTGRK